MNVPANQFSKARINPESVACFVELVFGYLEGFVPVRALAETGTPNQAPYSDYPLVANLTSRLLELAPFAATKSRGLYVVPATVGAPGSARTEDILDTAVILVDLDDTDCPAARVHLEKHLGPASIVVASGGKTSSGDDKLHLYWKLTEAATGDDLKRVRDLRELIARKVGGDPSVARLHQPIRVPGSIHGKNGNKSPVQLLECRGIEYELCEIEESARQIPSIVPTSEDGRRGDTERTDRPRAAALATTIIREGNKDIVSRFDAMSSVIGHWVRTARNGNCTIDEAWAAVVDHNAAMIIPPWDGDKVRREFQGLLRRDVESKGPLPDFRNSSIEAECAATPLSDDALADAFAYRHGASYRYVALWGSWFVWTGQVWRKDEIGAARQQIRVVCRELARTAEKPHDARRISSDRTIAAVARIAGHDPRLAVRTSALDTHPMLLNTPDGIVDLETGECRPHDPDLLITQMTAARPGAGCPRWLIFLNEITGGDRDLQTYLKRFAGYCLTGSTHEQVFAFFHGNGANGKSVFIQTIGAVLGDYAATAALDTFMSCQTGRHLTELAGLRAARLVIVPETEAGRSWAEARIKTVTGGETIRANFMHRDHFEFVPQFKLLVAGNHRPALQNVGEAMRRRLHLVPFDITIPPEQRDEHLAAKLMEERDGILAWMLDGCAEWQSDGLNPPGKVLKAASSYLDDEDVVGHWIEDRCDTGPGRACTSRSLFASWSSWAGETGHQAGTQKSFGEALRARGLVPDKVQRARGWIGISLRGDPVADGNPA